MCYVSKREKNRAMRSNEFSPVHDCTLSLNIIHIYISYWKNYNVICNQQATYNKIIYTYKTQSISDVAVCKLYL
jgi:hypothetical protein